MPFDQLESAQAHEPAAAAATTGAITGALVQNFAALPPGVIAQLILRYPRQGDAILRELGRTQGSTAVRQASSAVQADHASAGAIDSMLRLVAEHLRQAFDEAAKPVPDTPAGDEPKRHTLEAMCDDISDEVRKVVDLVPAAALDESSIAALQGDLGNIERNLDLFQKTLAKMSAPPSTQAITSQLNVLYQLWHVDKTNLRAVPRAPQPKAALEKQMIVDHLDAAAAAARSVLAGNPDSRRLDVHLKAARRALDAVHSSRGSFDEYRKPIANALRDIRNVAGGHAHDEHVHALEQMAR